jgi:hypothetical protein
LHTPGRVNDGRDSPAPVRPAVPGLAPVSVNGPESFVYSRFSVTDAPSSVATAFYPTTQANASYAPVFEEEPYSQELAFNDFNEDESLDDDEFDIRELLDEDS